MNPITNPDTSNTNPEYWETVLESHGLGLDLDKFLDPNLVDLEEKRELEELDEQS